ncbi:hypothetical protein HDU83_009224 [Entophlyctis luteolus]|nr:hypothetical protein HDU83_009224 [Entophlyctis luteolus]
MPPARLDSLIARNIKSRILHPSVLGGAAPANGGDGLPASTDHERSPPAPQGLVLGRHRLVELIAADPDPLGHVQSIRFSGRSRYGAGFDVGVECLRYFEITISKCATQTSYSSIGLVDQPLQYVSHPGTDPSSFGYKGQDGRKWSSNISTSYGPKFKEGDVVGCGFDFENREVFFVLNGRHLGTAFKNVGMKKVYAAIGVHDPGEVVSVNLGTRPFRFDLEGFKESRKMAVRSQISSINIDGSVIPALIQEYLLHSGYIATYEAFTSQIPCKHSIPPVPCESIIQRFSSLRRDIRQDILGGSIAAAKTRILANFPDILCNNKSKFLKLLLLCQEFIELCRLNANGSTNSRTIVGGNLQDTSPENTRKRKVDDPQYPDRIYQKKPKTDGENSISQLPTINDRIVEMVTTELASLNKQFSCDSSSECLSALKLLKSVIGLAAYENPHASPQGYLLLLERREVVADAVNSAILGKLNHEHASSSRLSLVLRQAVLSRTELRNPHGCNSKPVKPRRPQSSRDGVSRNDSSRRTAMFGDFESEDPEDYFEGSLRLSDDGLYERGTGSGARGGDSSGEIDDRESARAEGTDEVTVDNILDDLISSVNRQISTEANGDNSLAYRSLSGTPSRRRRSSENMRAPPVEFRSSENDTHDDIGSGEDFYLHFNQNEKHLPIEYTAIIALKSSPFKLSCYFLLSLISLGLLPLLGWRFSWLRSYLSRKRCSHFRDADYVHVLATDGLWHEIQVGILAGVPNDPLLDPFDQNGRAEGQVSHHYHRTEVAHGGYDRLREEPISSTSEGDKTKYFKYFEYRKQRYVFLEGSNSFVRINSKLHAMFDSIHALRYGLTEQQAEALLARNGENAITVESVSVAKMVLDKLTHPFYVFQFASVLIWTYEEYWLYASIIAVMSVFSIIWEIRLAKTNEASLRELVKDDGEVTVLRKTCEANSSVPVLIHSRHLVVGDVVVVSPGCKAAADIVLVQGDCVVDEGALTGESIPVVKTSLGFFDGHGKAFSPSDCKRNMLFCGVEILETKPTLYAIPAVDEEKLKRVAGIVVATGFNSSKGELFRGIMYPERIDFKFQKDAMVFIGALSALAMIAFGSRLSHGLRDGYGALWTVITSLDLITIAVPPALPLVLTIGISKSISRLKKSNIYCITPDRITYAGRIDVFCWDKTGTLTSPDIEFAGVDKCFDAEFSGFKKFLRRDGDGDMERALAACHSLNIASGDVVGSPVDKELFRSTRFSLVQEENTETLNGHIFPVIARALKPTCATDVPDQKAKTQVLDSANSNAVVASLLTNVVASPSNVSPIGQLPTAVPEQLIILRRFEFDPKLQRSSVIYQPLQSNRSHAATPLGKCLPWETFTAVTKGSPEAIRNICKKCSIPKNYHAIHSHYTSAGWYVLAVAMKVLEDDEACDRVSDLKMALKAKHDDGTVKRSFSQTRLKKDSDKFPARFSTSLKTTTTASSKPSPTLKAREDVNSKFRISNAEELAAIPREIVEREMRFLGFVLMQNPLKSESKPVLGLLKDANVKSVIITGDNALTALNVSRQLGLCSGALLVDVFDGKVGFNRLMNTVAEEPMSHIVLQHSSSVGSLASVSEPRGKRRIPSYMAHNVPEIRIRSGTATTNAADSACESVAEKTFNDSKLYPLEQIARVHGECKGATEIVLTGPALEMMIATRDGWMAKENLVGEKFLDWLVLKAVIFARMKPDQKTWIVQRMMKLGKYVAMCGDGANDSGALKAAHVGLALSDTEASIVAPFTSAGKRISDAARLLKEGRCTLDIGFVVFKFMFMYPLIQLGMVTTLNLYGSGLSNNQIDPADTISALLIKCQENTVVWLFTHFQFAIVSVAFMMSSKHRSPLYTNFLYILQFVSICGIMSLMQLSWEQWPGFGFMEQVFSISRGVQWGQRITALYLAATNLLVSIAFEVIIIEKFVKRRVFEKEQKDRNKVITRLGVQAGILRSGMTEMDDLKAKRSMLKKLGDLMGMTRRNDNGEKENNKLAWETYTQSVVTATANKLLETRLDIAAELQQKRLGDIDAFDDMCSGAANSTSVVSGQGFGVECEIDNSFRVGFDAWSNERK